MQSDIIFKILEHRAAEQGWKKYVPVYEQFPIPAKSTFTIDAWNTQYFLIDSPKSIEIISGYGQYNLGGRNEHEHSGMVEITNLDSVEIWVSFIKIIIQA